ncbi:hypothetical protein AGABI2DRAFT_122469 [Agaricus bisporus var. bisporus H97]|uniref:hypothetical protein n=1 Tax=Agaricus bisporus var. bisporus (strain H97 / ATCC MYA-4626 / FGSC 10389) TaxID=936046 RepID=UPI00029F721D|nr:hypothetical protein AGABI2DRAFT_122469 [Agaricus bisporus var. bisporus H97]EKV42896.1 hypothetical protein AGABI2DRAFT_122469 [Agaricus bisporus var. bisporus H97]
MPNYSDPVAEKADHLRMYMSNHPETLFAYAKWYGNVGEIIKKVEMMNIDVQGLLLRCTLKAGGKIDVYIPITPPLKSYEDVKPRLLEMKALAQEGLGIVKPPMVTKFYFPLTALLTISALTATAFCIYAPSLTPRPVLATITFITRLGGLTRSWLEPSFYIGTFLHVPEALYMVHLSRKHQMRFGLGIAYVIATLVCGFPMWVNLKKEIKALRIESAMKVE